MPTLEERVTRLEEQMDELKGYRSRSAPDPSDSGARPQPEHTATLNRHTAMHKEHSGVLARLTLDMHSLKDGMEQIIGMLDTLTARDRDRER